MKTFDLTQTLAQATPGSEVQVVAGEFNGTWVLDRPVRLVGVGPASVLWAGNGPVLRILSPGVQLEGLSIEVTDQQDGIALVIEERAFSKLPTFTRVRVKGSVEGLGLRRHWRVPSVIDIGRVMLGMIIRRTIGLDVSGPVDIRPDLAGLKVLVRDEADGRLTLQLELNSSELSPGTLLDGCLEIEAQGLISQIRLTGHIEPLDNLPRISQGGTATSPLDLLNQVETRPRPIAPAPFETRRQSAQNRPQSPTGHTAESTTEQELPESTDDELSWVESLMQEADAALKQDDTDKAIALLSQGIYLKPNEVKPHAQLALVYSRRGNFDAARGEWERVFALDLKYPHAYRELANCYNQLNLFDQAIHLLEQALRFPENKQGPETLRALGMAYSKAERFDEAIWALDQAQKIKFDPKLAALHKVWEQQLKAKQG